MLWAKAILHRAELGLRVTAKLSLVMPVILGMAWFSAFVDPAGIFRTQLGLVELEAVALHEGYTLAGYDQLAERRLMAAYVDFMEEPVETVGLGSSRILQLREDAVGTSFYNCGMSGGDLRDILGNYYLFERAGLLPQNLIVLLDPWLFNPNEDAYSLDSDEELYNEFLALGLGNDNGWTPAPEPETGFLVDLRSGKYDALLDPSYFQASMLLYGQTIEADEGEAAIVKGDPWAQNSNVKLADGSVVYSTSFREADQEEVNKRATAHAGTFVRMDNFYELDAGLVQVFEDFIDHVQAGGVNVIFLMVPYHPTVYNYATENADTYTGFFAAADWFVGYALKREIPLYGSYNPFALECTEEDFFDGLHIREQALGRILPDIKTILAQQAAGQAGSEWLFADSTVAYETAEYLVAERYEIHPPEVLRRAEDKTIHGAECFVLERWQNEGASATLLAWYAVTKDEGVIYRLDTNLNEWVVDNRF